MESIETVVESTRRELESIKTAWQNRILTKEEFLKAAHETVNCCRESLNLKPFSNQEWLDVQSEVRF